MPFLSKLRPDSATLVGVMTAGGVVLIYEHALPTLADIRLAPQHDTAVEHARKVAAWESAALIGAVFLVSRDLNSFIISGAMLIAVDYMVKHNNAVNPQTGKLDTGKGGQSIAGANVYPLPEYATDEASG